MTSQITLFVYDNEKTSYEYTKFSVEVDENSIMSIQDLQKYYASATGYSIKPGVWKYYNDPHKQWYAIDIRRGKNYMRIPRDKIEQNESIILEDGDLISMYLVHD